MGIEIGQRVSVSGKDVGNGKIVFVGETEFAKGIWVGIILDEQKGKNNGTIKGRVGKMAYPGYAKIF